MVKGTCKQERKTQLQQAGITSQAKEGARRRGSRRRLQLQLRVRAAQVRVKRRQRERRRWDNLQDGSPPLPSPAQPRRPCPVRGRLWLPALLSTPHAPRCIWRAPRPLVLPQRRPQGCPEPGLRQA